MFDINRKIAKTKFYNIALYNLVRYCLRKRIHKLAYDLSSWIKIVLSIKTNNMAKCILKFRIALNMCNWQTNEIIKQIIPMFKSKSELMQFK